MAKNSKLTHRYTNLYVKRRLLKLEIDIFGIIANGLLHHTPKHKIMTQLRKEIQILAVHIGLTEAEQNQIWTSTYSKYLDISKKTVLSLRRIELKFGRKEDYEESLKQRQEVIYDSIRARIQNNSLIKEANELMYQYEYREKHDELYGPNGLLDRARSAADPEASRAYSPFFLASSHPKPAKDHADWEGKMYYDESWEALIPDDHPDYARVKAYIRNHKLRSVQWVTGAPVYLVTRRNCKHYLVNIPLEEVLHNSVKKLLKNHKLYMPEEKPVSRDVLVYREYSNRLKIERALYELVPNQKLASDIEHDEKLVDKWTRIINNKN